MYERLSGLKKEKLLGRNVKQLIDEGYDIVLNPKIVKTGKPATSLQTGKRGKKLVLNGYPIKDHKGDVVLVVTFVRDVTLMGKLREQIRSQHKLVQKYQTNIQYINEELDHNRPLITQSKSVQELIRKIENFSTTDATVLLQGETGVGKDVFARKIHQTSMRAGKSFIKVDCPTIPEALLESELFGYAPGAFSGAHKKGKLGFFEMADKGTLFLDEIGELPLLMQAKLLRVLQDREIVRVGSTKIRKVDVRVISATNRDLEEEVRQGRFRSDLFYRLRVAVVTIPPLRERQEDVVPLALHFLKRYATRYKRDLSFEDDALALLQRYDWPGNIRELENLVQSMVITRQSGRIRISDLPSNMVGRLSVSCQADAKAVAENFPEIAQPLDFSDLYQELEEGKRSLKSIMKDIELQILNFSLKKHGSHTKVAKRFKVDRSTLFRKLRADSSK
jgi:transcriptional regulator with PAS, ATPase and Fis domain